MTGRYPDWHRDHLLPPSPAQPGLIARSWRRLTAALRTHRKDPRP